MTQTGRLARAQPEGNYEAFAWMFMRLSGLALIFLALFHFFWMHFTIGVENITFDTIVGRWTGPHATLWRMYDMFLLTFAFTHGVNGARQVVDDYFTTRIVRSVLIGGLWTLWAALILMGAWIIFTFHPGMQTPFQLP
jgi:succinate dehydrogenase / fumarate reductase membrane anchor subunit